MYGDYNDWIKTYGSWGSGNGQFRHPQGIDRDAYGKIYVADTGNHRIIRYKRIAPGYYFGLTYGTYGSGTGQFRNPKAIVVGRTSGMNDNNIYVADTGNQRIVRLNDGASGITWVNSRAGNMVGYSSVATDWYGGVWVTDDFNHRIEKLDRYLNFLDSYGSYGMGQVYGLLNAPTDFSIYFSLEKISGVDTWVGHDATFLSESWGDNSGGVCYEMGTDVKSIGVDIQPCPPPPPPDEPLRKITRPEICPTYCTYFLTDYSKVTLTVHKLSDNSLIRTLFSNQTKAYGQYSEYWDGKNNQGSLVPYAQYYFKISANSLYAGSSVITKTSPGFWLKASEPPEPPENIPTAYALLPNYPNPFNPQTLIKYDVPALSRVRINVFDLLGRQIRILVDQYQEAGAYRVLWDGLNERGQKVESGIYFYHMEAGDFVATRKMTLLR
ncbi:MAG: T9SS type A sorting domain-containing protein [candidate division KSB1 bacterium]|nr:T9SS type A sorting domain-containing protein [candidate division KSB1 bacterium]MDZ7366969.1 T9SS type A sorting domain-containing protein [candidate division KSB1 bacterium]MDZ7406854.1 T9SS type A sorting domain-containing protein [candidate division KSB1 bacterium]